MLKAFFRGRRGGFSAVSGTFLIAFFAAALFGFSAGCNNAGTELGEDVLASVDGDPITVTEFRYSCGANIPDSVAARQTALSTMINKRLVAHRAKAEGVSADAEIQSAKANIFTILLPIALRRQIETDIKSSLTDEELEFYRPETIPTLEVTMAIAKTEEAAEAVRSEVAAGKPFEEAVTAHKDKLTSPIPAEREVKMDDSTYPAGVRAMLNGMKPGELSPVARIDEVGYVVFRLDRLKDSDEQWKHQKQVLRDQLIKSRADQQMEELTGKLLKEANVLVKDTPQGPMAIVNGTIISTEQFLEAKEEDPHSSPHAGMNQDTMSTAINNVIREFLQAEEAERRGLDNDPEVKAALQVEYDRAYTAAYLDKIAAGITVTPQDVKEYYEKNKEKYTDKATVRLSRILLFDEKKAADVKKMAESGKNFAGLAAKYSMDESTKELGGDVGYIDPTGLTEPLKSLVASLTPGQVGGPVKSPYGFELIKLTESRPVQTVELAEVEASIRRLIPLEKRSDLVDALYKKLYKDARVQVNPKLLEGLK